jgi:hypothetical protein
VTQLNDIGRKLGHRLLANRLAHETEKKANHSAGETSRTLHRNT